MSEQPLAPGALSDIRVVEFAQALAVPYCGKILGDLGATVTKFEPFYQPATHNGTIADSFYKSHQRRG